MPFLSFQDLDLSKNPMKQVTIFTPVLKMRKLRHEEVSNLPKGTQRGDYSWSSHAQFLPHTPLGTLQMQALFLLPSLGPSLTPQGWAFRCQVQILSDHLINESSVRGTGRHGGGFHSRSLTKQGQCRPRSHTSESGL